MPKDFETRESWLSGDGPWHLNGYTWPIQGNASFGPNHWWRYASGFGEAGDRLLHSILSDDNYDSLDILVMPTLFVYRHYIELAIKAADRSIADLLGEETTAGKDRDHTVLERWNRVFERISKLPGGESKRFSEADQFIAELEMHDPRSFAFRYPESNKGEPHVQNLPWVNYARLAAAISRVKEAINYIEGAISYAHDCSR